MAGYKNSKAYESDSSGGSMNVPDSLRFGPSFARRGPHRCGACRCRVSQWPAVRPPRRRPRPGRSRCPRQRR